MLRTELRTNQSVTVANGSRKLNGWVCKLNPKRALVEDSTDGRKYNVPYELIVSAGAMRPADEASLVSTIPIPTGAVGDTIEITTGSHKGTQFKVTKVNSVRFVGDRITDGVPMTIPFSIAKVVMTVAEKVVARHKVLTDLGMTSAEVVEFEKKYL